MKKIALFDLDGTIVEYGEKIDDEMIMILLNVKKLGYELGLVSERKIDGIFLQLRNFIFSHIFSECGSVYHKYNGNNYKELYKKNIRNHPLFPEINILIKEALLFLSNVDYYLTGHFVDLRNGLIYISLIGMQAKEDDKQEFIRLDKQNKYCERLLNLLIEKADKMNILSKLSIRSGGTVGIVIYPIEWNKSQIIGRIIDGDEILYFGDQYKEGGNDYEIINSKDLVGYSVKNVEDTKRILNELCKKS